MIETTGMTARRYVAPILALALTLTACASATHSEAGEPVVVERLFFGRNVKDREPVSDSEWKTFLEDVVTPRFPKGFSVWEARGQFRDKDGVLEHEASFVLEVIHPLSGSAEADIDAITAEYKRRFRQKSVLHLMMQGRSED